MSLLDYENRKQLVESYRWKLSGWLASPTNTGETVSLSRWEDKDGNIIDTPPTTLGKDGKVFYITENGEHEVFLRMPYYGTIAEWREILFADMTKRVKE